MHTFSPTTKIESAKVNENFTDLSTGDADIDNNRLQLYRGDTCYDHVKSGLVWSLSSGLNGTMTTGIAYVTSPTGLSVRLSVAAIASRAFTASKDTYVDLAYDGTIYYTEVANGATTGFGLSANRVRLAKVVTNGSTITSVQKSDWDAMGEEIRPRNAFIRQRTFGYNHASSQTITAGGGMTDLAGATFNFIKKTDKPLKIILQGGAYKITNTGEIKVRVVLGASAYFAPDGTGWTYFHNTLYDHRNWSWQKVLYDIPAGSYPIKIQAQAMVDSLSIDTQDTYVLTVEEA